MGEKMVYHSLVKCAPSAILLLAVTGMPACAESIRITDASLTFPGADQIRVVVTATSKDVPVGSYYTELQFLENEEIPQGFVVRNQRHVVPEKQEIAVTGDRDNGPFDEDPREGTYARTFSVKGWKPGLYALRIAAHNRPATGPYVLDTRSFPFRITAEGKVVEFNPKELEIPAKTVMIYKQQDVYACFPSLAKQEGEDTLSTGFGTRVRRSHIDPTGGSKRMVSRDGGLTWSESAETFPLPQYKAKDGRLVRATARGWVYVNAAEKERLIQEQRVVMDARPGTVAYLSPDYLVQVSEDGKKWKTETIPAPDYVAGLMVFRDESSYIYTSQGIRLVAIYGKRKGVKEHEVFILRSADDGKSWQFIPLLPDGPQGVDLNETALVETAEGTILAMARCETDGYLWRSTSTDGGLTWSRPERTELWGHPAHLLRLPDGRILCTYGYRKFPMGIRACVSSDHGRTWPAEKRYVLRADGSGSGGDLGYPITARLSDGTLFTIYYFNGSDNITHIAGTRWQLPE